MSRLSTFAIGLAALAALAVPGSAQTAPATSDAPTAEAPPPAPESARETRRQMRHHGERSGHFGSMGRLGGKGGPMMIKSMLLDSFDADGDGTVSQAELDSGLNALTKKYDADANGTLSLDEFAGLHAELMRPLTVRAFQWIDADGDGQISEAERAKVTKMIGQRLPKAGPAETAPAKTE